MGSAILLDALVLSALGKETPLCTCKERGRSTLHIELHIELIVGLHIYILTMASRMERSSCYSLIV